MYTIKVEKEFDDQAITLRPEEVGYYGDNPEDKIYTYTHTSGWTISAAIQEEYHMWINVFHAEHPKLGKVAGNFEDKVESTSEEAYKHFIKHHPYETWDYSEI